MNKSFKSNSSLDNSSSNINPNNIKIISINNSNIGNPQSSLNKKPIPNTPKSSNVFSRNRLNIQKSNSNSNENKKIKIVPFPIYYPSTSQKNQNIKKNSNENDENKKISLNNAFPDNKQNKLYDKIKDDFILDENLKEKNIPRTNQQLYQSLKLPGNKENTEKENSKVKIINENNIKEGNEVNKVKEENDKDKETIVDDYNNNILVEFKKNANNKKEFNRNNRLNNNNVGIYNNNRKIIKMLEKNKINDKK